MKKNFNKKPLIALFVIGLVVAIGGTIAYYTDAVTIPNIFGTKTYTTQVTEVFEAPDNWQPGQTVNKDVTATNTGDIEVAVRAKYVESWKDKNGDDINLTTNPSPVTITVDPEGNWTTKQSDDYYYYKTFLAKDASTTKFIDAVTLNADAIPNDATNCTKTQTEAAANSYTQVWTCGTDNVFAGGEYTLTVTVETVQSDAYTNVWDMPSGLTLPVSGS